MLPSLGKTFLGDANLVPPCTVKFVCLHTTLVAFFSFSTTLSPKKSDKAQGAEDRYLV